MTPGAQEFIENIKRRNLRWANSTILTKIKQDTKAVPPWLERRCRPCRIGPTGSSASVGPTVPNHTVTGWLVFFSPGLGVTCLLQVQKIWESLFWVNGKEEKLKSRMLFLRIMVIKSVLDFM